MRYSVLGLRRDRSEARQKIAMEVLDITHGATIHPRTVAGNHDRGVRAEPQYARRQTARRRLVEPRGIGLPLITGSFAHVVPTVAGTVVGATRTLGAGAAVWSVGEVTESPATTPTTVPTIAHRPSGPKRWRWCRYWCC